MASDLTTFSATSIPSIFQKLQTRKDGLTEHEIGLRLQQYGKNVLSERKEVGVIAEYFSHFKNPLAIILLFAAGISAYLGEIKNLIVIAIMVVASVTLDFVEEHSANNAAKKLTEQTYSARHAWSPRKKSALPQQSSGEGKSRRSGRLKYAQVM